MSTDKKLRVLSQADCLLSAGTRQRSYFYGWLVQAGRFPRDEHFIRYVPVSLGPDQPQHVTLDPGDRHAPHIVSGGGWFPWQNQTKAIFAACHEVVARDRGVIELYGSPHETPNTSPEERAIRDVYRQVQSLAAGSPRVRVQGYVGRDRLVEVYRHASVALEVMRYNLERELAFTTRTIEYLWCGLPVLYNNYGEIAQHIRDYDAGWTVDPDSDVEIALALEEVFGDAVAVRRKSANAQRLVHDRFTWDKTVLPLVEFLRRPDRAFRIEPVLGSVSVGPSYFGPRLSTVRVPLRVPRTQLRQHFMVPAEHARRIELPFTITQDVRSIADIALRVKTAGGRVLAKRTYVGSELPPNGRLEVVLPLYWRVRGGERLILEVLLRGQPTNGNSEVATVGGISEAAFPLLANDDGPAEPVLALTFSHAIGRLDAVRALSARAIDLVRRGQGRLVLRAAARRMPRIASRVGRRLLRRD